MLFRKLRKGLQEMVKSWTLLPSKCGHYFCCFSPISRVDAAAVLCVEWSSVISDHLPVIWDVLRLLTFVLPNAV